MPLDLSILSPEDVAAATAAIEASWKIRKKREHREMEEHACQEAAERRVAEAAKEVEAQKEAAERKAWLSRDKRLREEVAEGEWQQALSTGLLGLKLTIPPPSVISRSGSGLSTQSKGKRKVTEEALSAPT
jgi:alkylation response protein AidB-like acyl-CoA dehydrogenase